ncbi:MAG: hypothetical protein JRF30_01075 [Deltaproteobacteria bacterium]|nr:hypothetical protein [Deltaproteobacteria bacterium]MBW1793785.1 hypothetical protein [Deltaproteobacteria bacterium]MBW2329544.1 hypothetical protein [Deltaproteobacteria bacterium]
MSNTPLNLIRYLFILNVNSSLVWLSKWPSIELSIVLGNAIANRLPTVQARSWKKALAGWDMYDGMLQPENKKRNKIPEAPWPIEAVLFWYPAKRTYGEGERILWELKLMNQSADHGLFLEVILPALEQIGNMPDPRWQRPNNLWGHFDIQSVYTAKGMQWKPLIKNGRLDFRRKVNPSQWFRGLKSDAAPSRALARLTWLTPFELPGCETTSRKTGKNSPQYVPSLTCILEAIVQRISSVMLGKYATTDNFLEMQNEEALMSWNIAMEQASHIPLLRHDITEVPPELPGRWIGSQIFATSIPDVVFPYLELACILHIGKYTHYGCGNLVMS